MKIKKIIPLIMICLFINISGVNAKDKVIKIAIDDWCPYVCNPEEENGKRGYTIDVLKKIFNDAGYEVIIKTFPFTRVLMEIRRGKYDICPAIYKTDAPDFVFSQKHIGISQNVFYVLKGTTWKYTDEKSLYKLKKPLGVIQDYQYDPEYAVTEYAKKRIGLKV